MAVGLRRNHVSVSQLVFADRVLWLFLVCIAIQTSTFDRRPVSFGEICLLIYSMVGHLERNIHLIGYDMYSRFLNPRFIKLHPN